LVISGTGFYGLNDLTAIGQTAIIFRGWGDNPPATGLAEINGIVLLRLQFISPAD